MRASTHFTMAPATVIIMLVMLWVCIKICFISDAQGKPGFFIQAWHESPIATLIMIPILLIVGSLILKE